MKRGVLLALVFLLSLTALAYAQNCDFDPVCQPNITSCGCGGTKTRYQLCEGGCSDWYPCSVPEFETECTDGSDDDCDNLVDCTDPDCAADKNCMDSDDDGYADIIDCLDSDKLVHPGAPELCNARDDDCDGDIDEDLSRPCGQSDIGICSMGKETCQFGSWLGCDAVFPQAEECDNLDNDCDGDIDNGCACVDGDVQDCSSEIGNCQKGTQTCIGGAWGQCVGAVFPKIELCGNNIDDDCDGKTDEDCPVKSAEPAQANNITPSFSISKPAPAAQQPRPDLGTATRECIDKDGDGYGQDCLKGFDCDDTAASVYPGAPEACNNIDEDCDSLVDDHLNRACGLTSTGICTFGTEQCIGGKWVGCTAVLPSGEICANRLDDDCDGLVDENCDLTNLSKDELALKQFLDIEHGRDNYDLERQIDNYNNNRNFMNVRKSSTISNNRTRIRIEIVPVRALKNFTVYEYIPKFIASSADKIRFTTQPEIIQADPLVAWHFAELTEKVDLSYDVPGEIEDAEQKTSTITVAEDTSPIVRSWYFDLLPLLFIPVLGLIFILLVEISRKRR